LVISGEVGYQNLTPNPSPTRFAGRGDLYIIEK